MKRGHGTIEGALRKRSLIREVNERIRDLNGAWGTVATSYAVLCECTRLECAQRVHVPTDVYEGVRIDGDRFVVAPEHEHGRIEHVVAEDASYRVVRLRPDLRPASLVAAPVEAPAA